MIDTVGVIVGFIWVLCLGIDFILGLLRSLIVGLDCRVRVLFVEWGWFAGGFAEKVLA